MKSVKIANSLCKLLIYYISYKYFEILYFLYTSLVKNLKPYTFVIFTIFIPKAIHLTYKLMCVCVCVCVYMY